MSTPTAPQCLFRDALGIPLDANDEQVLTVIRGLRTDSVRMSQIEAESYVEIHRQIDGRCHLHVCARDIAGTSVRACLDLLAGRGAHQSESVDKT